jgi:hypothetical protein
MPALLPVFLATSRILLVADDVPKLNYEPSCRAAVATAAIASRDLESCKKDEEQARTSLTKVWTKFSADQRGHCVRLTSLGGPPSYVELLTCLEMARDSSTMRDEMQIKDGQIDR